MVAINLISVWVFNRVGMFCVGGLKIDVKWFAETTVWGPKHDFRATGL